MAVDGDGDGDMDGASGDEGFAGFFAGLDDEIEKVLGKESGTIENVCRLKRGKPLTNLEYEMFESGEVTTPGQGDAVYIVNAMFSYKEAGRFEEVIAAMNSSAHVSAGRMAVMLAMNYPAPAKSATKADVAALKAGLIEAARTLHLALPDVDVPVWVTFEPFEWVVDPESGDKAFPYGTMRNRILDSTTFAALAERFWGSGMPVYVSFQDFDDGSRLVDGKHIFLHVDRLLMTGALLDDDERIALTPQGLVRIDGADRSPIRPLCIAGGYKPAPWGRNELNERIDANKLGVRDRQLQKAAVEVLGDAGLDRLRTHVAALIDRDMKYRTMYSDIDPMFAYFPEPNLFVDAAAIARPRPVPQPLPGGPTTVSLRFGPGGAEAGQMMRALADFAILEISAGFAADNPDRESLIMQNVMNNRHPDRGVSLYTAFGLRVETDVSRLAYSFFSTSKLAQDHTYLSTLRGRVFKNKSGSKGCDFDPIMTDLSCDADDYNEASEEGAVEPGQAIGSYVADLVGWNVAQEGSSSLELQSLVARTEYGNFAALNLASGNLSGLQRQQLMSSLLLKAAVAERQLEIGKPSGITLTDLKPAAAERVKADKAMQRAQKQGAASASSSGSKPTKGA